MPHNIGIRTYLAIKKQTAAATPVKPDTYVEYIDEDLSPNYETLRLAVSAGTRSKVWRSVAGKNGPVEGTINLNAQANTIGHFLLGAYGQVATTGPTDSAYTHVFTDSAASDTPYWTMDIGLSDLDYVWRTYGLKVGGLGWSYNDNALMCAAGVKGMGMFTFATVTTTASTGTTLVISSTKGLTTSDTIKVSVGDATNLTEYAISSIDSETQLTLGSTITGKTHTAGDFVAIKASTPSYSNGSQFVGFGGTEFKIGTTLAGVAAVEGEDLSFNISQDLKEIHAYTGANESDRNATAILTNGYEATMGFGWYHQDPTYINYLRARQKLAVKMDVTGDLIGATARDKLTFEVPKLSLDSNLPSGGGTDEMREEWEGTAEYDSTTGLVTRTTLINTIASY